MRITKTANKTKCIIPTMGAVLLPEKESMLRINVITNRIVSVVVIPNKTVLLAISPIIKTDGTVRPTVETNAP